MFFEFSKKKSECFIKISQSFKNISTFNEFIDKWKKWEETILTISNKNQWNKKPTFSELISTKFYAQKNCFKAKSKNKLKVFLVEIYYN